MAQGDVQITVVGNLVADPELKYTQNGTAVANFRVASTPRVYRDGQWVDGEGMFLTCSLWREAAENAVESLSKGMRVIVQGRLRQRSYETREGERRTVFEVEVDEVGPSLKFARAQVTRTPRNGGGSFGGGNRGQGGNAGGGFGGGFGGNQGNQGGQSDRGFGGGAPAEDPWNSAPPAGGGFGGDEPPF
ncbi:single-stranded DNA-binding protein [Corynebacterium sp. LK19]|uniref:single-stranded DNA-binding protein n=1 Tax=unclassified Corynebacterium TaxID=2624378 RepID=UPI000668AFBD|nr:MULTISPECIES: single-stranded DNA-binding protein [unclassified Corynebacterium]MBC6748400.1 single-stranded DNA-binding protein [Corynebacterium sp. LK25]TXS59322.1 single-stranded DNA-binding protein [Corynebacterium sp. LK19]TXS84499.1 single-stranded DNA-binding protein [Corynebacterium sp. LK10]